MKHRYQISKEGRKELTDAEITKYRDPKKLLYNYQRAKLLLHKKPLYKDPKSFLVLILIVALAIFIAEVVEKDRSTGIEEREQQVP
ncbi:MAG: hypothetical protein KBA60_08380 [Flavobacteriales bacterium]|nr:hypothetical protein [Flavobacteriales bacterium]HQW40971.1 hypothetical protein [Flavobacteriales bacterium]